jgi:hypothetical protein
MRHSSLAALCAACLALVACGEPPPPPPVDETVFRDQVRALDKARGVEDQLEERKRELDRQVERDADGEQRWNALSSRN